MLSFPLVYSNKYPVQWLIPALIPAGAHSGNPWFQSHFLIGEFGKLFQIFSIDFFFVAPPRQLISQSEGVFPSRWAVWAGHREGRRSSLSSPDGEEREHIPPASPAVSFFIYFCVSGGFCMRVGSILWFYPPPKNPARKAASPLSSVCDGC